MSAATSTIPTVISETKADETKAAEQSLVTRATSTFLSSEAVQTVRQAVVNAITKARTEVADLRKRVLENPRIARASERATEFLELARVKTETALAAFTANTPASASQALEQATAAVSSFKKEAAKLPGLVSARADAAVIRARQALDEASSAVLTWRSALIEFGMRKATEFDNTFQVSRRGMELAKLAAEQAKLLDAKYNIYDKTTAVLAKAQDLNTQYSIAVLALSLAQRAQAIGDSLTGTRVTPAVEYLTCTAFDTYNTSITNLQTLKTSIETTAEAQAKEVKSPDKSE